MQSKFDKYPRHFRAGYVPETDRRDDGVLEMLGGALRLPTAPCVRAALSELAGNGNYNLIHSHASEYFHVIMDWMKETRDWDVQEEWIVPTHGTLSGMVSAFCAFGQEGDGVIINQPYYTSYPYTIEYSKRKTVLSPMIYHDGHYDIDLENLESLMANPENRFYILNNPNNPIMDYFEEDTLRSVAALAKKYHVLVLCDEIYADHPFGGGKVFPYGSIPDAQENSIIFISLGKSFNFTGVSHANAFIADPDIRKKYIDRISYEHGDVLSTFMYTAIMSCYSKEGYQWIQDLIDHLQGNMDLMDNYFKEHLPQVKFSRHRAGSLAWIDWNGLGLTQNEFKDFMINEAKMFPDFSDSNGDSSCFTRMQFGFPRYEIERSVMDLSKACRARGWEV